jgi:hypothetical protein
MREPHLAVPVRDNLVHTFQQANRADEAQNRKFRAIGWHFDLEAVIGIAKGKNGILPTHPFGVPAI